MRGKVKFLKKEKGFGFVTIEGEPELFFHFSDFTTKGTYDELEIGDEIEFKVGDGEKGKKAVQITKIAREDERKE